uniref:Unconventional myosin-XVIIIa n=1 Tax=Phallusia mammillata TaxID=59560 RepID=A0A6F9DLT5_9ASCI|nr:unconventional myosin-XVIIIa [Phallusia mammillata]
MHAELQMQLSCRISIANQKMFGRKKNKEEKREKKRHKHGMTQAEITKLEEVGLRRGFFSKKSTKREKDEQKLDTNSDSVHDESAQQQTVLERATSFGPTVQRKTSSSQFPPPMSPQKEEQTKTTPKYPIPPTRKKSLQSQPDKAYHNISTAQYDVPKPVVPTATGEGYDVPHSWKKNNNTSSPLRGGSVSLTSTPPHQQRYRKVILKKRSSGDFGVSLRRSVVVEHVNFKEVTKVVFFAEPGAAMLADEHSSGDDSSRLFRGDRLVEIDGINVENAPREAIVSRIKLAGDQVTFLVQSMTNIDLDIMDSPKKPVHYSDDNLTSQPKLYVAKDDGLPKLPATKKEIKEKPSDVVEFSDVSGVKWKLKEKIWFMFEGVLCSGHVVESDENSASVPDTPEGKKRIQLEVSHKVLIVPEEDVDLANDAQFDRVGDISSLRHLNESSMIHTLTHRYEGGLLHSFAGPHLITTTSCHSTTNPSLFSEKMKMTYKGSRFGDNPPHVYAIAQRAHQQMMTSNSDQCIISLGQTGTSKTMNNKKILEYFATVASNSPLKVSKMDSVVQTIESFTCAVTQQCKTASRCVCLYNLDFDRSGAMVSTSVQILLLERNRLVHRPNGEANFNIFYQLLLGADVTLRRELFLLDVEQQSNPLLSNAYTSDSTFEQMSTKGFSNLQHSLETLDLKPDEIKAIFYVVAACIHLGVAGFQLVGGDRLQFARADSAQKAASLLGVSVEKLSHIIFQQSNIQRSSSTASMKRSTSSMSTNIPNKNQHADKSKNTGQHQLDSFIISLYAEVISTVVTLVNRSLTTTQRAKNMVLLVDAPGYQPSSHRTATFADLSFNYVQDCLHSILHHNSFTLPQERYQQESVECEMVVPDEDFISTIEVVDKLPVVGSNGSKGLLWILDEEAASPGASDESFIERLFLYFDQKKLNEIPVLQRNEAKCHFQLLHQAGALSVEYDASGWLEHAKYKYNSQSALETLQDSKKKFMSEVFGGVGGEKLQGSVAGLKLDVGNTLRRATSFRNAWSTTSAAAVVKKSSCMLLKRQIDCLMDIVRRGQPHFILSVACHPPTAIKSEVDFMFFRKQIHGFQLLSIARAIKEGYPEHMVLNDFRHRFDVLLRQISKNLPSNSTSVALMDDKEATENIIKHVELSRSQFRVGVSQVFFRSGVLNLLEDKRNEKVSAVLVSFQAACRGYLARRRLARRKVQEVAVRCIQRNIRKFMAIRQWPWWRLLTKVLPLVEVTRTEEDLREKQAEFDLLKEKFDRVVEERDEFKLSNSKYETRLQEVLLHLEDEHTTATHASELLEHETKERIKLEKQLKELQINHNVLQNQVESMEVELAEKRLLYSDHQTLADSDEEIEDGEYKAKYERAVREYNFELKKQKQQFEDAQEEMQAEKKSMERKISQIQEEADDQHRIEQQTRKKLQRLHAQLSDAQIHLEETNSKNFELEKKQRKFDSELYSLQADITDLKISKDRTQREKDKLSLDNNSLDREILEKDEEVEELKHKLRRLEEELEDNNSRDTDDRQLVNGLKKQIRELEAKLKDQEEELEEQATSIHTLEQTRERLEMSTEQARQQRLREMENKEDELEEMRISYHKKIKQLEFQLEEEEQERATMSKHRRDLEQELADLKNSGIGAHDVEMEKRLRRDLKRYKALLADAQTMIDHLKADVVSKQQMRQLKAQLEESEYTCAAAVKSRKSIELEVDDLQAQLEEVSRAKQDAETRVSSLQREIHELRSKMEEDDEDSQETIRKYKSLVAQHADQQTVIVEAQTTIEELKQDKNALEDKVQTLQSQIHFLEESTIDKNTANRLDNKAKDLETKLEFQKTANRRLEVQLTRVKENNEKLMSERDSHIAAENREREAAKLIQRQLREAKNDQTDLVKREQEALKKKHDLEMDIDESQNQIACLQADLKLAFKRISDLQMALEDLEESDVDEDNDDDSMSSSDEEFTRSQFGWRSRISTTSGVSERARTTSSRSSSIRSSPDVDGNLVTNGRLENVFSNDDEI